MIDRETKNCIVCGDPATVYSGHVHLKDEYVTAGWCKRCIQVRDFLSKAELNKHRSRCSGCFGGHKKSHGVKKFEA